MHWGGVCYFLSFDSNFLLLVLLFQTKYVSPAVCACALQNSICHSQSNRMKTVLERSSILNEYFTMSPSFGDCVSRLLLT
jgi:hypothetical protein